MMCLFQEMSEANTSNVCQRYLWCSKSLSKLPYTFSNKW